MMGLARGLRAGTLLVALLPALAASGARAQESADALPNFPGREDAFAYCAGCHSMKVVGRQGMSRARWDDTLSWMTEKHAMPAPDADTRALLLDYLAQAFPSAPVGQGGWTSPFAPRR